MRASVGSTEASKARRLDIRADGRPAGPRAPSRSQLVALIEGIAIGTKSSPRDDMLLRASARSIAMAGGVEDDRALGVEGRPAGDEPVVIPEEVSARSMIDMTRRWFLAYTLALLVCAPTCAIYRTLASHLVPRPAVDAHYVRHRGAADRMIAALPPGWAVRCGLYITFIDDDAGTHKAYAYVSLAGDGRPFLTAGFHAASGSPPAQAVWDLSDSGSPGRFQAWLDGMIRARGESERGEK